MLKKFFTYPVLLVIFLSFLGSLAFGGLVKYHYDGGKKFKFLRDTAIIFASVPINFRKIIKFGSLNLDKPLPQIKHENKEKLKRYIPKKRNALLVLPRYDQSLARSVVEVIDLINFEVLHTYKHNVAEMHAKVENNIEFPRLKIDNSPIRFLYQHPLILDDGSMIGVSDIAYKIDFCSNLQWINDEEIFHHSLMLDHEDNIWVGGQMNPKSKYVKKYSLENYDDDSIIKINTDGKILFNKSVTEILIENKLVSDKFALSSYLSNEKDPIHLNDIEPALTDTEYWKKGDLFISIRNQNAIFHYRPSDNKVLNYITGPFTRQHDVDIISDNEISIFNNNNSVVDNEHSEVLVYNFQSKKFKKLFNDQLKKSNFKTDTNGLSEIFKDGALMAEETNHGLILLINNEGKKELELINKADNGLIGSFSWSRIIEDDIFIKKFKSLLESKKCTK